MKVKNISKVLSKSEIKRLRAILTKESEKPENKKYEATLFMYITDLEEISFHYHYLSILWFMKYYRTSTDVQIKNKLKEAYNQRMFNLDEYKQSIRQKFYKYTKKDYPAFLKRAEYFFSLYKKPFDIKNRVNEAYLNRAYLGLGFEFLLKAIFLKKGYTINEIDYDLIKKNKIQKPPVPTRIGVFRKKFLKNKTSTLNYFIDALPKLKPSNVDIRDFNFYVMAGLFLCQNWRNQDIHTPTGYRSIDNAQVDHINSTRQFLYKLFLPKIQCPKE